MNEEPTVINIADHQRSAKDGFAMTPTASSIHSLLHMCRHARVLGLVIGDPGVGKTEAALAYGYRDRDVAYLKVTKSISSVRPFLKALCEALDCYVAVDTRSPGDHERFKVVVDEMRRRTPSLLIVDEAQNLENDALELVRDLYDESKAGIAMIANPHLSTRWARPNEKGKLYRFTQLQGRIGKTITIARPLQEDIDAICDVHGIRSQEARSKVTRVVRGDPIGQLHNVEKLVRVARTMAVEDAAALTAAQIDQAALLLAP